MQIAQDNQESQKSPESDLICTVLDTGAVSALGVLVPLFGPLDQQIQDWPRFFFNGAWGPKAEEKEYCERAERAIESGALVVRKTYFEYCPAPHERLRRLVEHPWNLMRRSSGESLQHQELKYSCLAWLKRLGIENISVEQRCLYGIADIALDGVTIECGSTPARRLGAIGKGLDGTVIVPFLSQERVAAYLFTLGEGWRAL